jgi:multidrug efflux system membrane fusion protein
MTSPHRRSPAALALAAAALLGACSRDTPAPEAWLPVRVETPSPAGASSGVRYTASVTPWSQVDVAFKANGYIAQIRQQKSADGRQRDLQSGDPVAKGAELARVRDTDYADKL